VISPATPRGSPFTAKVVASRVRSHCRDVNAGGDPSD
jgi:hypothetical protein